MSRPTNFVYVPSLGTAQLLAVTSEDPSFPARNTLLHGRPKRTWHAMSASDTQNLDYACAGLARGVFFDRPNVQSLRVFRHDSDNDVWGPIGAQILLHSKVSEDTVLLSSWTQTGSSGSYASEAGNVYPQWGSNVGVIIAGAGGGMTVAQDVVYDGGSSYGGHAFGVWARRPTSVGGAAATVGLIVHPIGVVASWYTFTPTDQWAFYEFPEVVSIFSLTQITVSYGIHLSAASSSVAIAHAQAANCYAYGGSTTPPRLSDWETDGYGLVVYEDERRGRRQMFYDLGPNWIVWPARFRVQIPGGQGTDTGDGYYEHGNVAVLDEVTGFPGRHMPLRARAVEPFREVAFPSGSREVIQLGDTHLTWEFDTGYHIAEDMRTTIDAMRAAGVGNLSFLWEYQREPGAALGSLPLPHRCGLVRRVSELSITHPIPELMLLGLGFEEVI